MKVSKIKALLVLCMVAVLCVLSFACSKEEPKTPIVEHGEYELQVAGKTNVAIMSGDSYFVGFSASENGKTLDDFKLKILYQKEADKAVANILPDGKKVTIQAKEVSSEQTITVVVALDVPVEDSPFADITVTVLPKTYRIQQNSLGAYTAIDGGFATEMFLATEDGTATEKPLDFGVYDALNKKDAPVVWSWESGDQNCIVDNQSGKLIAQSVGTGIYKGTAQVDGKQVTTRLVCTTTKAVRDLTSQLDKKQIIVNTLADGTEIEFEYEKRAGDIQGLWFGDVKLSASANGNKIVLDKAAFETTKALIGKDKVLSVETTKDTYLIKADVFSDVVDSIDKWNAIADATDKSGYYILTSNIDFSANNQKTIEKFCGTIDGDGYALKNVNLSAGASLFKGLNGTVKNIAIEVSHTGYGGGKAIFWTDERDDRVAYIENVYIKVSAISKWSMFLLDKTGGPIGGWSIKNLVIDTTNYAMVDGNALNPGWFGLFGELTNGGKSNIPMPTNVVAINVHDTVKGRITKPTGNDRMDGTGAEIGVYVDGTNGIEFPATGWDSTYWTVDAEAKTIAWKSKA